MLCMLEYIITNDYGTHLYIPCHIVGPKPMSKSTPDIDPSQWALNTITNRYVAVGGAAWKRGMKAGIIADNNRPPIAVEKKVKTVAKVDHLDTSERDQLYQQLKALRLKDKLNTIRLDHGIVKDAPSKVSVVPRPVVGVKMFGGVRPTSRANAVAMHPRDIASLPRSCVKLAKPKPRIKVSDMTESEPPSESDVLDL